MVEASGHRPDYEPTDADPYLVAILAAGVALFLIASPYLLLALYPISRHEPISRAAALPPAPRLQIDPDAELATLRNAENGRLSHYGWADRAHGIVHLPIDRAMQLTAKRGLPGWAKP
jgi:hypothetical protein